MSASLDPEEYVSILCFYTEWQILEFKSAGILASPHHEAKCSPLWAHKKALTHDCLLFAFWRLHVHCAYFGVLWCRAFVLPLFPVTLIKYPDNRECKKGEGWIFSSQFHQSWKAIASGTWESGHICSQEQRTMTLCIHISVQLALPIPTWPWILYPGNDGSHRRQIFASKQSNQDRVLHTYVLT